MTGINVLRLAEELLDGAQLTPGQVAELRAISAMSYSALAREEAPADLFERVCARLRMMLTTRQTELFDENFRAWRSSHDRDVMPTDRES